MVSRSSVLHSDPRLAALNPVQSIVITVNASATFDASSNLWTYSYEVVNEVASANALETFALRPMHRPVSIGSPQHWLGTYGTEGDSTAVGWSVIDYGLAPPSWDGAQLFLGPYHPAPGQATSGFSIVSRQGPSTLSFYAQGFDTLQTGGEDGVESAPTVFAEGVTGNTIGPDVNSVVGVGQEQSENVMVARLLAPAPNPASGSVTFSYSLSAPADIVLSVFDAQGRLVRVLDRRRLPMGYHSSTWSGARANGRPAAAGVYFLKLTANGKSLGERKVILLK